MGKFSMNLISSTTAIGNCRRNCWAPTSIISWAIIARCPRATTKRESRRGGESSARFCYESMVLESDYRGGIGRRGRVAVQRIFSQPRAVDSRPPGAVGKVSFVWPKRITGGYFGQLTAGGQLLHGGCGDPGGPPGPLCGHPQRSGGSA